MNAKSGQVQTIRSIELAQEGDFPLGALLVRPSSRDVVLDGKAETIEPRVMQVLVALARRRGEVVSREELIDACWSGRLVSEDALNRCMTKLRKIAAPHAFSVETIPRVGYRLVPADPAQPTLPDPPAVHLQEAPAAPIRIRTRLGLPWLIAAAALLIVVVVGASIGLYRQLHRPYFAVLPFDVVGSDSRAATLAAAIPVAISHQLRMQAYQLVPLRVTEKYGGDRKSAAADDLEARYFISGTVHVERGRLRVVAHIDAGGRVSVWSQEFSVDAANEQAAPEHIAMTVSALFNPGVRMLFENPPHVTAAIMRVASLMRGGDDMGAYVATRELWRKSPETRLYAIYHVLAIGSVLDLLPVTERRQALLEGRRLLAAMAEDPTDAPPLPTLALTVPTEWMKRESVLRHGLELAYTDASGLRRMLANHLANSGRLTEALALSEQALAVDRASMFNVAANAYVLDTMGRVRETDAVLARAQRHWPGNEFVERSRFSAALARRDAAAMTALLTDASTGPVLDPASDSHPLRAIARAMATQDAEDIDRLETECAVPQMIARDRSRFCLHALALLDRLDAFFALAPHYFPEQRGATAGERDERWLADPRVMSNVRVLFRRDTSNLRRDERLIPVLERLGLVDYWRDSGEWPDFCDSEPASVCDKLRATRS